MEALVLGREEQIYVRAEVEDDGGEAGGRLRVVLDVNLRKDVLQTAQDVEYSPEGGAWLGVSACSRATVRHAPISNIPRPSLGRTSRSTTPSMITDRC